MSVLSVGIYFFCPQTALLTLLSRENEPVYADLEASPTRNVQLLLNCLGRTGITVTSKLIHLLPVSVVSTRTEGWE